MMQKIFTLLSLLLISLSAYNKDISNNPGSNKELILTKAEQSKALDDNAFTLKLFKTALTGNINNNLFLSPLSVSMAMSMVSNGANGKTLQEIRNTMNFNNFTESQLNAYYQKLITQLPQLDSKTSLKIANSIWYKNTFTPLSSFLNVNTSSYNAKVQRVDFSDPATKDSINNWVSLVTNGKITNIANGISPREAMYLINAVYFKSPWANKFDAAKTKQDTFSLATGGTVQAAMMNTKGLFRCAHNVDANILELPYSRYKFSMVLLMPTTTTMKEYAAGLDLAKWQSLSGSLSWGHAVVAIPKFKFSSDISLNGILSSLGMSNLYGKRADFTRIDATRGLHITQVKHKGYVEVDEEGTEAAAASSMIFGNSIPIPPNYFKFDHPFIFAIRETTTGLILFTGVVNDPTKS
jgi:serine protease inhibitor